MLISIAIQRENLVPFEASNTGLKQQQFALAIQEATVKPLCPRCKVGWINIDRCPQCGYRISSAEEKQEKMGRLVRNSLIGLVSVLAGIWVVRLL